MLTDSDLHLIEEVLSRSTATDITHRLNAFLSEEREKRESFYNDITEFEKAEFINGEIIVHSPVKLQHNEASNFLHRLLSTYVDKHRLGFVGYEKIMITLSRNDYEPDLCFFGKEKARNFTPEQSLFPAPDLVVEVLSKSTEGLDRGVKFDDYQHHGILEYWIIDPVSKTVEQYRLNEKGAYELLLKAQEGTLEALPVPGFSIGISSIFDAGQNMEELVRLLN